MPESSPLPKHPRPTLVRRFWTVPLLCLIALMTVAPLIGAHSTKMDFLGQFLLQASAGTAVALLAFVVNRRWLAAGLCGTALMVQLAVLQPSFFPAHADGKTAATVDVLFANIWWRNQRIEDMAEAIMAIDADIVVLVELNPDNRSILDELAGAYPYRSDCLTHWTCDSAILSRLPIEEDLSAWQSKRRIAMSAARMQTAAGPIAVAGVHLDQPLPPGRLHSQERQAEGLTDMLAPIEAPLLLVGDFNSAPWGRLLQGLADRTGLEIAWGLEGTWPSFLPWPLRIAIDHALTGRGLVLVDRQVIRLPGTDHKSLHLRVGLARPWSEPTAGDLSTIEIDPSGRRSDAQPGRGYSG